MDDHSDTLLPAAKIRARYNRSDKTLSRWLTDPDLGFPKPIYIRNRRYFREAELLEWELAQASKARAA